ncbi:MAG: hypothetical protein ACFFDP_12840 [Promethearchaeota archaeon]
MPKAERIKDVVTKVEKSIEELAKQMTENRKAMEDMASKLTKLLDASMEKTSTVVTQIRREVETFEEQRRLLESQLKEEVEREKTLTGLKDLEEAIGVITEIVEELSNKIDLDKFIVAVQRLEESERSL